MIFLLARDLQGKENTEVLASKLRAWTCLDWNVPVEPFWFPFSLLRHKPSDHVTASATSSVGLALFWASQF